MNIKYDCYSIETLKHFYNIGKKYNNNQLEEMCQSENIPCNEAFNFAVLGATGAKIDFTVKTFYRIGEPIDNGYGSYKNSYNFADDKREIGVSVVSLDWLNSLKAVFFGISNEKLTSKGVYKIEGFVVGFGGDDEPLIYPVNWAEKTKIRSKSGLIKALKSEQ